MPSFEFIRTGVRDGVATVTLDRPPLNILSTPMLEELNAALEPWVGDPGLAAIVLRARGKAFSAGVDIADHTRDKVRDMLATFHGVFRRLAATDALTIAAVHGAALGGGCELACFCDLVLASDRARFGQPEVRVGVFPPVAAAVLPGRIGAARTIELIALGEALDAAEALRIGLANRVFPADEFEARVDAYLGAFAGLSRPVVRLAKRSACATARAEVLAALERAERLYLDELMRLADAHEGLAAFLEKRPPAWRHA